MTPLQTLQALRPKYPTPMSNAQLGEMLNATAWVHRSEGYGLLKKPTGANCPQPVTVTPVSRDILCVVIGANLVLWDCLIDSDGAATPTWDRKDSALQDLSRWIVPVDVMIAGGPEPEPEPPPVDDVIPYNEQYSVDFGEACNAVYEDPAMTEPIDAGMISVQSQRCAWDYYVGGMTWAESSLKHINELRKVYGLPPVTALK